MIISRTPFRISFVGGGTDLKSYWEKGEPGQVISTAINKYIYVSVKRLADIYPYNYRISWNELEFVDDVNDIQHPIIREAIKLLNITDPLEVVTYADLPSQSGLGSSSSFAVGLLNALHAFKGEHISKKQLAEEAAHIEINLLKRKIGTQDHFAAAHGDVNIIKFLPDGKTNIRPVPYKQDVRKTISNNLMMFYTGKKRDSNKLLQVQSQNVESDEKKYQAVTEMKDLVPHVEDIFLGKRHPTDFGEILHKNWVLKRSLSKEITDELINNQYERALQAGAGGGKLLGAGGGGFLLFYVELEHQQKVKEALSDMYELQFDFESQGSQIIYFQPDF